MRFYPGANDYLWKVSKHPSDRNRPQHLYLVVEANNKHDVHAVMLHNGRQKLGSVTAAEAPEIKKLLTRWRVQSGADEVIECRLDRIYVQQDDFKFVGSIKVSTTHRVNERLARKFAGMKE